MKPPILPFLLLTACATTPPPPRSSVLPPPPLVFHQVRFVVDTTPDRFRRALLGAPLARIIRGTDRLPGVDRTEPLTPAPFPEVGSVRRVVLCDGQSAREEVLAAPPDRFRYLVTDYTSEAARPIAWGLGEFTFTPDGERTQVTWRYTFGLRGDRFPGSLGALGRRLFRSRFLERDYAAFMQAQVVEMQALAKEARS
jgi:hypothetical protein